MSQRSNSEERREEGMKRERAEWCQLSPCQKGTRGRGNGVGHDSR